jgi:hypothetical protein
MIYNLKKKKKKKKKKQKKKKKTIKNDNSTRKRPFSRILVLGPEICTSPGTADQEARLQNNKQTMKTR